jgi:hypothetical protein
MTEPDEISETARKLGNQYAEAKRGAVEGALGEDNIVYDEILDGRRVDETTTVPSGTGGFGDRTLPSSEVKKILAKQELRRRKTDSDVDSGGRLADAVTDSPSSQGTGGFGDRTYAQGNFFQRHMGGRKAAAVTDPVTSFGTGGFGDRTYAQGNFWQRHMGGRRDDAVTDPVTSFGTGGFGDRSFNSDNDTLFGGNGEGDDRTIREKARDANRLTSSLSKFGDASNKMGGFLRRLKPTMGKYMQLLAAMIPIAVALAPALLGVAGAMGAVALAGGSMIGLGLLGHADSLAGSMAEAEHRTKELKQELFQVFQPAAQQFAPIQSRAFDELPGLLGRDGGIAEKIEGMGRFEDTLFQVGYALVGGLEESLQVLLDNERAIENLTEGAVAFITTELPKFLQFLFDAATNNQGLLKAIGKDLFKLVGAAYQLSIALVKVLTAFSPLVDILVFISNLLNSKIIVGLVAMIGWLFVLGKAAGILSTLAGGFMLLRNSILQANGFLSGYIANTTAATLATLGLATAVGILTGGLSLLAGSVISGSLVNDQLGDLPESPTGGRGTVINDNSTNTLNVNGVEDYGTEKRLERQFSQLQTDSEAQEIPNVNGTSNSSISGAGN